MKYFVVFEDWDGNRVEEFDYEHEARKYAADIRQRESDKFYGTRYVGLYRGERIE